MFNYVALYFLIFLGETQAEWNFFLDTSSARPVFFNFGKEVAFPRIMIGKFGLECVCLAHPADRGAGLLLSKVLQARI